jgi:transcriptional regulator with XRE-family HTH domain
MVLLRHMLGDALRRLRLRQGRTLREVSAAARVSLGYLSEVERGQKEASSELLASICGALGAPLSQVLREVSDSFALAELQNEPVYAGPVGSVRPVEPALNGAPAPRPAGHDRPSAVPAAPSAAARRVPVPAGSRLPLAAQRRITVRSDRSIISEPEPVLEQAQLPVTAPQFERIRDITNMVPV